MRIEIKKVYRTLKFLILFLILIIPTHAQISSSTKYKIFDKVWETINKKYYDPNFNGVDWLAARDFYRPRIGATQSDNEFYALVKQMVGDLRDAHTTFRTPQEVQARKQKNSVGVGIWLGEVEGKIAVFGVAADSEAARAGIRPGMILTSIDGRNALEVLAEKRTEIKSSSANAVNRFAYARLLSGQENTIVKLTVLDSNGRPRDVLLGRRIAKMPDFSVHGLVSQRLSSNIGYIRFDEFESSLLKQYKKALIELKDTKGLIIDLRFNSGGDSYTMEEIAERLFSKKVSFGQAKTRSGKMPKFLGISLIPKELFIGDDDMHIYSAPVIVLISGYSASAAEHFAIGMQESGRAKILGQISCGCLLGIMGKTKIEGSELYLSQVDFISAQGKRIEGVGVIPDLEIPPTISDLQSSVASVINRAAELLNAINNSKSE